MNNDDTFDNECMTDEEALAVADEEVSMVALLRGKNELGHPTWYYLMIKPSRYQMLANAPDDYSIEEYGDIIFSGMGEHPPEGVQKAMDEQYGTDHTMQEKLVTNIKKAQKEQDLRKKYRIK